MLASAWGAGDALAGHLLRRHMDAVVATLTRVGWPVRPGLGGICEALTHRTGQPRVDRVVEALDRAARAGSSAGYFLAALAEGKPDAVPEVL